MHALLSEKNNIYYLISSLSALFWPEASRNSSAEVTDLGLKLNAVFSNNKGESNGVPSELILLCVGGCGALEGNPEKQRKHTFYRRLPLENLQTNIFNVWKVVHLTLSLPLYSPKCWVKKVKCFR